MCARVVTAAPGGDPQPSRARERARWKLPEGVHGDGRGGEAGDHRRAQRQAACRGLHLAELWQDVSAMRVVRLGGRYLAGREQRLWTGLAGIILAPFVLAGTARTTLALALGVGATFLVPELARRLRNTRNWRLGERIVTDALRRLPDDYCLVNDVVLGARRGNVDHVLIGPCGVVPIETKRLAGHIRCDGDTWYVKGRRRNSISKQVNAGATAVRYFLMERHPELRDSALRWVESIIVFTHPLCRLEVDRARAIVVRFSELLPVVRALADRRRVSPEIAERLARSLVSAAGK